MYFCLEICVSRQKEMGSYGLTDKHENIKVAAHSILYISLNFKLSIFYSVLNNIHIHSTLTRNTQYISNQNHKSDHFIFSRFYSGFFFHVSIQNKHS